jgi:hypothetical protein
VQHDVDNKPARHVPRVVSNMKPFVRPVVVILPFPLFPVGIARFIAAIVFRPSELLVRIVMIHRAIAIVTVERGVATAIVAVIAAIAGSLSVYKIVL